MSEYLKCGIAAECARTVRPSPYVCFKRKIVDRSNTRRDGYVPSNRADTDSMSRVKIFKVHFGLTRTGHHRFEVTLNGKVHRMLAIDSGFKIRVIAEADDAISAATEVRGEVF